LQSIKSGSRCIALGRKTRIAVGLLLAIGIGVALFDWNWLRGPLVNYLHGKSGREVRIGDLHVTLAWTLEPTVRLRGVYIENAAWASRQPMAAAGEVAFTFSLDSLRERRPIVSRLVLIDADVDMERRADGLRNWRLNEPDYRGPGRVQVRTLEAQRSKVRFINGEAGLDMTTQAAPAEPAVSGPRAGDTLSSKLVFTGDYQGVRFEAAGLAGSILSFRDSNYSFPFRGHLTAGKTRADVDGIFADIFDSGPMDAKVRIAGPTLSRLHPFLKFRPPVSRPYVLEAQISQSSRKYTFAQLQGKVGDTALAGEATYDRNPERPLVDVSLRSASADLMDMVFLAGVDYRAGGSVTRPARVAKAEAEETRVDPDSGHPLHADRLRTMDAHLKLELVKLRVTAISTLDSLHLAADLVDGALRVTALDLGVAGGHITGSLTFDGQVAHASLGARNLRLERLLHATPSTAQSAGAIRSQLRMTGQGNSLAAVLANSTGSFAAIVDGGRISNLLDAKLGLNAGKALGLRIRGDRDIALHCGAAAFDFHNGMGKSQIVMLETAQTHTDGTGTIDLRNQSFDLLLTPQPKNPGLFTLRSSIRVDGSFKKVNYKVESRVPLQPGGSTTAPATITALFRPLLDGGQAHSDCAAVLGVREAATKAEVVKE
jgi:uncharacterized protein involved in outer membrane biogenesis